MNRSATLFILGCSALSALSAAAAVPAAPRLTLGACTDPALPKDARCGIYEVFENRAARKGRKIPLRVVVLPALEHTLKCSHLFNILDASNSVGVTERTAFILNIRKLALGVAKTYVEQTTSAVVAGS